MSLDEGNYLKGEYAMDDTRFHNQLDRRGFLKLMGAAGALALASPVLQACAPQAAQAPGKKEVLEIKGAAFALNSNIAWVPIHVGLNKGFFEEAGLKASFTDFANPPDAINSIGRDFDTAYVSPQNPINAYRGGNTGMRIIGSLTNAALTAFVALKNSPVKEIKDLKGGKVGIIIAGGTCHIGALAMLAEAGLGEKDVTMISGGGGFPEYVVAVKTGQMTSACMTDPLLTKTVQEGDLITLWSAAEHLKPWMESVVATNTDVIKSKGEALRRLMAALQKASDYTEQNLEEAAKIWAQPSGLTPEVAMASVKRYPKGTFTTKIVPEALQNIERMMKQVGIVKSDESIPWSTLVDVSFLPEAQRTKI